MMLNDPSKLPQIDISTQYLTPYVSYNTEHSLPFLYMNFNMCYWH